MSGHIRLLLERKNMRIARCLLCLALGACALIAVTASAQPYPSRPVHLLLGFPPGAITDAMARLLAQQLTIPLGQQIIVENRAGAAGTIAADVVAKAKPDGYTLLLGHMNSNAVAPALFPQLPYNPARDFAPIGNLAFIDLMLVVPTAFPASDVQGLIALARQRPEQLRYASSGVGSSQQLAAEMFMRYTKTQMTHVPYKGGGQAVIDLIAGHVDLNFDGVATVLPHVRSGKLKPLGVASLHRVTQLPAVPTISESGVPGFEAASWFGVFAPAATPPEIVAKLSDELLKFLKSPDIIRRVSEMGAKLADPNTPAEYGRFVQTETARWAKLIREANIKID
jgi:tripartite-type tricarboxylate transporter receptor subunit TctC